MRRPNKAFCLFVSCIILISGLTSCDKIPLPTNEPVTEDPGFWGEDVTWYSESVRTKNPDNFIPLLQKIKDHPEEIPSDVYQWAKAGFPQVEIFAEPENIPEYFEFFAAEIIIYSSTRNEWEIRYEYQATLDGVDPEKNGSVVSDFWITFKYYNNFRGATSISEYTLSKNESFTEDGKVYSEGKNSQCISFDLNPGIGIVLIRNQNTKSEVSPPEDFWRYLCDFKRLTSETKFKNI